MEVDIKHIAKLAKLEIEESKIEKFTKEMQDIFNMVENLPELSGTGALLDPEDTMALRKDAVRPSTPREEVLENAAKTAEGCFVVPKTVE